MVSMWTRFQEARKRAKLRSLLAEGRRDDLIQLLERHYYPAYLLDTLIKTHSAVSIEVLAAGHRSGRISKWYLEELLKSLTDPGLRNSLNRSIQGRADHVRHADKENERITQEQKEAAAKEKARKSTIRRCPKCGDNPETYVRSRDIDDGWRTNYWYACRKCESMIIDGNGCFPEVPPGIRTDS